MIMKQWEQVVGLAEPPKTQTRRPNFPHELAVQLWKYGWSYPRIPVPSASAWLVVRKKRTWAEHQERRPITDTYVAEANRILGNKIVTLPVQPRRTEKSKGRIEVITIRRERLGDISDEDCLVEGISKRQSFKFHISLSTCPLCHLDYRLLVDAYACLWQHVYGKGAWDRMKDDDVWVLDFEVENSPE